MHCRPTLTALFALVAALAFPAVAAAAPASNGALIFSKLVVDSAEYENAEKEKFVKPPEGGLFAAKDGRLNQLTENPGDSQPAFSPDGRTVAFVRNGDLYAMRADGSGQRSLTSGPEVDGRPVFSPDGRLIVFERAGSAGAARDLLSIRSRGGGPRALAPSPADEHEASFSPDGRLVVFVRGVAQAGGGVAEDLYSVRPSGARPVRLTRTAGPDEFAPFYCRGGIAFSRGQSGEGPGAFADIYTMRRDGREVRPLIRGAGSAYVEDVTPNGRLVLFRRDQGLWVKSLPAPGKRTSPRARKLTEVPDGSDTNAVFASDGRDVAAFAETESATEARQTLTAISVANGRERELAEGFAFTQGTVTTEIGPVIAWQPVRSGRS